MCRDQIPLVRWLVQRLNATLGESRDAYERSRVGEDLGLTTDEEVVELIEWRPKLQLLLTQSPDTCISQEIQFALLYSATRPRLFAGIAVHKMRHFEAFLVDLLRGEEGLLGELNVELGQSARDLRASPHGLAPALDQRLSALCDRAMEEYAKAYPDVDTTLREVVLKSRGVATPDAECRGRLLRVGEPVELGEANRSPQRRSLLGQVAEDTTRGDSSQLLVVPDQADAAASLEDTIDDRRELLGPHHPRLIEDNESARPDGRGWWGPGTSRRSSTVSLSEAAASAWSGTTSS